MFGEESDMSRIVVLVNSLTGDLYKHTYEDSNMDYIPVFESVEEARGYVQSIEEYGVVKKGVCLERFS